MTPGDSERGPAPSEVAALRAAVGDGDRAAVERARALATRLAAPGR